MLVGRVAVRHLHYWQCIQAKYGEVITLDGRQRASLTGIADLPVKLVAAIVHILLITFRLPHPFLLVDTSSLSFFFVYIA